jgi:CubicO group peptidase (beta-lactamase class C family)
MIATTRRSALLSAFATTGLAAFGTSGPREGDRLGRRGRRQVRPGGDGRLPRRAGPGRRVVENGEITLAKGYGVKRMGAPARCDENTIFGIASNTKAMTAAALAMLVEEGKVEWDAPVTKLPAQFRDERPGRHQADDRPRPAGPPQRPDAGGRRPDDLARPHPQRADIVAGLKYLPIGGQFRGGYAYDNVLYVAAGEVIAAVTGKPWEVFIQTRILTPAGHDRHRAHALDGGRPPGRAARRMGPPVRGLGPQTVLPFDGSFDSAAAAGGLNTTAKDIAKWMQVQLGLGALPAAASACGARPRPARCGSRRPSPAGPTARRPTTRCAPRSRPTPWAGSCRIIAASACWHTGGLAGFISYTGLLPGRKSGIMIMTNAEENPGAALALRYGGPDRLQGRSDFDWIASSKKVQAEPTPRSIKDAAKAMTPKGGGAKPSLPLAAYAGSIAIPGTAR